MVKSAFFLRYGSKPLESEKGKSEIELRIEAKVTELD
jgi:hypothetical protein